MIRKEGNKYIVRSHQTGKSFGSYKSKKAAQKRLRQIKRFK
jgi:hypothetical protein